ncbi:hypothetical protein [Bacillus paralicheniformis]|nr:hypothetical protein [Bacillus paralicheniformis]
MTKLKATRTLSDQPKRCSKNAVDILKQTILILSNVSKRFQIG